MQVSWSHTGQTGQQPYAELKFTGVVKMLYIYAEYHECINEKYLNIKITVSFLYARLKNGTYYAVAMSVRPSVHVFQTFLQHALRYQFETWYIHLVGGPTCRV